jgi:hypothetical protein
MWQEYIMLSRGDDTEAILLFLLEELMGLWDLVDVHDTLITDYIWDDEQMNQLMKASTSRDSQNKNYSKSSKKPRNKSYGAKKKACCACCQKGDDCQGRKSRSGKRIPNAQKSRKQQRRPVQKRKQG